MSSKMTGGNLFFFQDGRVTQGDARLFLGEFTQEKSQWLGIRLRGDLASAKAVWDSAFRGLVISKYQKTVYQC